MRAALAQALKAYTWNAELVQLSVTLMDLAELQPVQLTLFDFDDVALGASTSVRSTRAAIAPFARLVDALQLRHAGAFFGAQVTDAQHAVRERRFQWTPM
jgi:hypothetical protein